MRPLQAHARVGEMAHRDPRGLLGLDREGIGFPLEVTEQPVGVNSSGTLPTEDEAADASPPGLNLYRSGWRRNGAGSRVSAK